MAGLYFEEFQESQVFKHGLRRTVSEADNTMFSLLSMNPRPLHFDAHFSEGTEWGQRLFNSMFTWPILVGMSVQDTSLGTTIGNLDTICAVLDKPDIVTREAETVRRDGFCAKAVTHPKHVPVVDRAFIPRDEELAWACQVRGALASDIGAGVVQIGGQMIDKPHERAARALLAAAGEA